MGENSKIEWTDHTLNPWVGCTKVSPACDHCYAESWARRTGSAHLWQGERRRTSPRVWRQAPKWNAAAGAAGVRARVFCASLADVFDNKVPRAWRRDLFAVIRETPHLDWLLLTKRPGNIPAMLPPGWGAAGWPNVWLGATAANQDEVDRNVPALLSVPAGRYFLSCEPLLGPIELSPFLAGQEENGVVFGRPAGTCVGWRPPLDWIIVGGASGGGARPMQLGWARAVRDQCQAAGVPFFFKQWGEWAPVPDAPGVDPLSDRHHMRRVGRKAAGAQLDGREWREMPDSPAPTPSGAPAMENAL